MPATAALQKNSSAIPFDYSSLKKTRSMAPVDTRAATIDLIEAQHAYAIIDVQPSGVARFFQSAILAVDPQARTIAIDELFPALDLDCGAAVDITLRLAGERRVTFTTRVLDIQTRGETRQYRIAMPVHFTYNQRRQSYRFRFASGGVEFRTSEYFYCAGSLQDISLTGARALLDHKIAIDIGDVLNNFAFEFSGCRFRCDAIVKHHHRDIEGRDIIGIEFLSMPRAQQRTLEKTIFQWHRVNAKQQAKSRT